MKKKIFGAALIAAMAITAGWNFCQSQNEMELSDLVLANVEALAQYEDNYYPNGCLDQTGDGCWYYREYPKLKEATWN